ncbi:NAD(P)/FAD-dependent oxidoreductase [Segnochrobactraceae bacterium EtOH-i3]
MTGAPAQKVLIAGGGIYGLLTAWWLAKKGVAVEIFDKGPLPCPGNSSHDEHRITRHAYGKLEHYARMMPRAFKAWDTLWEDLGVSHYHPTGSLYCLRVEDGWYAPTTRALDEMGIGYHDVPLSEVAEKYPYVETDGLLRAVWTDGTGLLFPIRIMTDVVVRLLELGVKLHAYSEVTEIDPEAGTLVANGKTYSGDQVVVSTGPWIDRLVPGLRGVAVPSRQAVAYLAPPPDLMQAWRTAPIVVVRDVGAGLYTLPPRAGARLKVGDHRFSREGNADEDRTATEHDLSAIWPGFNRSFARSGEYGLIEGRACFYTVTEDEGFIVKSLGARGFCVSACSGHGFKLSALISWGLAEALTGARPAATVGDWAAAKLSTEDWQ